MNNPCYRCEKRQPGCHAKCAKYLAFHEERKEICKKREADRQIRSFIIEGKAKKERAKRRLKQLDGK